MTNVFLISYSTLFISLCAIIYFSKKRVNFIENKIYSIDILVALVGSIIEILSAVYYLNGGNINSYAYLFLSRLVFVYYSLWINLFLLYTLVLTNKKVNIKNIFMGIGLFEFIIFVLLMILPFQYIILSDSMYPSGAAVLLLWGMIFLDLIIMLFSVIKNYKLINKKKFIPLFILIILGSITLFIQTIFPNLFLTTPLIVFVTFLMYFTIENPDMKLIAQLNEARDQAEKANNAKSEFLSNMSHEIRTPLNAIVGFSQALLEEDINNNAKEEVKDIVSASSSLLEIVNGILDISKIESGKLEIVNTEYNLNNILNDLVALTKARMGEKPLEFRTNFDPTIPSVLYGDHVRVKQIILNLLTNAVKYTKEGYIEFKVSTVRKDDIIRLIISVEDSGIGIKEDKIDKLFSKFERLDIEKNNTIEGTGLGLAITKRLIELMNGKIVVQSVYGKGSRFTVAIDQKIISDAPLKEEKITVSDEIIDCSSKKVLIVDDNKLNLKVASRLLEKYKCDIETIDNGLEAIELIKKNKYDLILLDDMMHKLSGTETLLKLKEIDNFDIPVVALTANAITGMKEKYLKAGFNDYLSKPIDKTELNRIINEFLK